MKSVPDFILWPIVPFGAEDQEPQSSENPPNPPANQGDSKPPANANDEEDDDEYKEYSPRELRRLARDLSARAKTAEGERDSFKSKVDESERKTRTNEENLKTDLDNANAAITKLRAVNAKLAIINAINGDSKFQWHSPEMVAQQLNSEIVKVDEDGNVEGIAKELARVAKDHPFLLKKQAGQSNNAGQPPSGPTGFQPGQGGATQGGSSEPNNQELLNKYPALASRLNR